MTYLFSPGGLAALHAFVTGSTLHGFDLDGTLAPIVADPADIAIPDEVRRGLIQLVARTPETFREKFNIDAQVRQEVVELSSGQQETVSCCPGHGGQQAREGGRHQPVRRLRHLSRRGGDGGQQNLQI